MAPDQTDPAAPIVPAGNADEMLSFPATARNRAPIAAVLKRVLAPGATVLELACGSGEHAAWFARVLPGHHWRPTDADPTHARAAATRLRAVEGVAPVRLFDARALPWPDHLTRDLGAILAINLIHIAPWPVTEALMDGAKAALPVDGLLYLYGPFLRDGRHTAPSNAAFDQSLRARDASWGVRDLVDVEALAARHGLTLWETVDMPANNLSVIFRKQSDRPIPLRPVGAAGGAARVTGHPTSWGPPDAGG